MINDRGENRNGRIWLTIENDNFVGSVNVQALTKRERHRVVVQGRVSRRVVDGNGGMGQTSDKFLDVADTLYASDWRAEGRVIPEEEVETAGTLFCIPFVREASTYA